MRKACFLSFFILSSVQIISVLSLEGPHKLEDHDPNLAQHLMVAQEKEGSNNAQEFARKHDAVFPEKSQKPKGSYGGANLVHRRPSEKSAASDLRSSSFLIPTSIVCISITLSVLPSFRLLLV